MNIISQCRDRIAKHFETSVKSEKLGIGRKGKVFIGIKLIDHSLNIHVINRKAGKMAHTIAECLKSFLIFRFLILPP